MLQFMCAQLIFTELSCLILNWLHITKLLNPELFLFAFRVQRFDLKMVSYEYAECK